MSQSLALCFQGDEDKQIFFHGVAYVNMMPLLCPGVKQIRGAFRVFTYQESEVFEKVRAGQAGSVPALRLRLRRAGLGAGSTGGVVLGAWL